MFSGIKLQYVAPLIGVRHLLQKKMTASGFW